MTVLSFDRNARKGRGTANLDAERAVLGTLMVRPALLDGIGTTLRPEHFSDTVHRRLYGEIAKRIVAGRVADPITLLPWFISDTDGAELGLAYLATLVQALAPHAICDYAQLIRQAWQNRKLIEASETLAVDAENMELTIDDKLLRLESRVEVAKDGVEAAEGLRFVGALAAGLDKIRFAIEHGTSGGLGTGFPRLDRLVPLLPGRMVVLGGATSMGKTAFGMRMATNVAWDLRAKRLQGIDDAGWVLVISLEMTAVDLATRAVCLEAGVAYDRSVAGEINESELARLEAAEKSLDELPIWFEDMSGQTPSRIHMKARALRRRFRRVRLILIDHLQLVRPDMSKENNSVKLMSDMVHAITGLAKEFDCPVLALAQLKRDVALRDDHRPHLEDLAWASAIEQNAHAVLLLHREAYYLSKAKPPMGEMMPNDYRDAVEKWETKLRASEGRGTLLIDKNRGGRTGEIDLLFDGPTMRFEENPAAPPTVREHVR